MSQFCTMPAGERKMRAAAICREVHSANGDAMDLGIKVSTPKDIMLEELSLQSNRGSRLFKMRQRRSEKYTFESIQNEANMQLSQDILTENTEKDENKEGLKTLPNTGNPPNTDSIAPGYGGPLKDMSAEASNSTAIPKSYHSPWQQAIINDPALAETLNLRMPIPEPRPEAPDYKSFNRVATPFGGFDKAPRSSGITFKLPEIDLNPPSYPELQDPGMKRPTFNRVAQGWISDGAPIILPTVPLEPMPIPESDDL
ncbi:myozenin-2 [Esox lucius]|uniref:Myozenin-2 n=1 Tax=Esox lucius TaxID=8010 RepID=C1BXE0_ESOLU|nr:myozenin-2b [Esox lucius]ACO13693.1 Myozenin-2 [Esox lucius]